MVKYKRIYLEFFGYGQQSYIPCEICSSNAVDIHHIEAKGMGGSKTKDYIANLMALCRKCHTNCHTDKKANEEAQFLHFRFMLMYLKNMDKLKELVNEFAEAQYNYKLN